MMGMIIRKFEDGTILEYKKGSFNPFCIFYTNHEGVVEQINGNTYLRRIKNFSILNKDKLLLFELAIKDIYDIKIDVMDESTKTKLDTVVDKYKNIFLPNDLYWEKMAYLILSIFIAEDNWKDDERKTILGRDIYLDETLRVGILNDDVDETCKLYTGKSISEIRSIFNDTKNRIESKKGYQKTIFDF